MDREQAADSLRAHCIAGRLTADELDERLDRAYRAKTLSELAALHADLPELPAPSPPAPAPRRYRPTLPGTRGFRERRELAAPADAAVGQALAGIAPALIAHGYRLETREGRMLAFVHRKRPLWTILVAIFLFPLGLLALLVKDEERVVLDFEDGPRPGGSTMTVQGLAPASVRAAFRRLEA